MSKQPFRPLVVLNLALLATSITITGYATLKPVQQTVDYGVYALTGMERIRTPDTDGPNTLFLQERPNGKPVQWDQCTIPVLINPTGSPDGTTSDIKYALTELNKYSYVKFRYAGESAVDGDTWEPDGNSGDPIVVAFTSNPTEFESGNVIAHYATNVAGGEYTGGLLLGNTNNLGMDADIRARTSRRVTYVHELAHALGLAHNNNPNSLMYPYGGNSDSTENLLTEDDETDVAIVTRIDRTC